MITKNKKAGAKVLAIVFAFCGLLAVYGMVQQPVYAASQSATKVLPNNYGKLVVNVWRSTGENSGHTKQFDYLVSATYKKGTNGLKVESIKASWVGSASLRNSASISLGKKKSKVSASGSSSWQHISTKRLYWENTNGANNANYGSNMIVKPRRDYRAFTIALVNTGKLKLKGDERSWTYSAGV